MCTGYGSVCPFIKKVILQDLPWLSLDPDSSTSTLISDFYVSQNAFSQPKEEENERAARTSRWTAGCVGDCSLIACWKQDPPLIKPALVDGPLHSSCGRLVLSRRQSFAVVLVCDCVAKAAKWSNSGRVNYGWHIGRGRGSPHSPSLPLSHAAGGRVWQKRRSHWCMDSNVTFAIRGKWSMGVKRSELVCE